MRKKAYDKKKMCILRKSKNKSRREREMKKKKTTNANTLKQMDLVMRY